MCKALTLQLRRCRHNPRNGDYCGIHTMDEDGRGTLGYDHNGGNLSEICRRIRERYFDNNGILPNFSTNLASDSIRRYIYNEVMPFMRDCWKMGITGSDIPEQQLRIHYEVIGEQTLVDLPVRQWTPEQRTQHFERIRREDAQRREENQRQRAMFEQQQNQVHAVPEFPPGWALRADTFLVHMAGPGLQRMNAGGIENQLHELPRVLAAAAAPPAVAARGLPSIANDPQSVHRTSVNESVIASIKILNDIPWKREVWPILHEDGMKFPSGRKLFEHIFLWSDIYTKKESKELFPQLLPLIEKNYISGIINNDGMVFGTKLWIILYKTIQWAFERPLEEQKEIFKRMLEECYEGREMCVQGKMARFVNILCGFHPDIRVGLSGKELLQDRMAKLAQREGIESEARIEEGREILRDAAVPEVEWDVWLEPLLLF